MDCLYIDFCFYNSCPYCQFVYQVNFTFLVFIQFILVVFWIYHSDKYHCLHANTLTYACLVLNTCTSDSGTTDRGKQKMNRYDM